MTTLLSGSLHDTLQQANADGIEGIASKKHVKPFVELIKFKVSNSTGAMAAVVHLPSLVCLTRYPLTQQDLAEGCKVLGVVVDVRPHEAMISLPHGLRGRVTTPHVSEPLQHLVEAARQQRSKGTKHSMPSLMDVLTVGQIVR